MKEKKRLSSPKSQVVVEVNVENIVKYLSIAGVAIVSIIFATRCLEKVLSKKEEKLYKEYL